MQTLTEAAKSPNEIGPLLEDILRRAKTDGWSQGEVLHAVESLVIEFRRAVTTHETADGKEPLGD